jgi:hypothetical protein
VTPRTIEDRLREQYFTFLPGMTRAAEYLKTRIEYSLLPISRQLESHENLVVKARVKECGSAIDKLRKYNPSDPQGRRNPGGVFDRDRPEQYSLLTLRDMVGVRVLVFPSKRAIEADSLLRLEFGDWLADPLFDGDQRLAFKYQGRYGESNETFGCEYQIVSTLIGLFWEVEHAAIYKQSPNFKGLMPVMQEQTSAVNRALINFEDEFERQLLLAEHASS